MFHLDEEFGVSVEMMKAQKYYLSWFMLDSPDVQVGMNNCTKGDLLCLRKSIFKGSEASFFPATLCLGLENQESVALGTGCLPRQGYSCILCCPFSTSS